MRRRHFPALPLLAGLIIIRCWCTAAPAELKLAVFDADATPPPGSRLCYDVMTKAGELKLRARGVVITGAGQPVVLCAVDWIGIANEGHDFYRRILAEAAGTVPERVAVHALHQHDSPMCDFTSEHILKSAGREPLVFDAAVTRPLILKAGEALKAALPSARPLTHAGWGEAVVKEVASNRRVPGPDGGIRVRFTACRDAELRAAPEGVIDPLVTMVSFWENDAPLAVLSFYATHPQSYYRTGIANPDFPGIARFLRGQAVPGALHVHFTGAGGNIGAGKYNDGSPDNRPVLAARLAEGMAEAWRTTVKKPITPEQIAWRSVPVHLPPAPHLDEEALEMALLDPKTRSDQILGSAMQLAWLRRCRAGVPVDITCLHIADMRLLHLPGETFVEYQLAARESHPQLHVAAAGYGQYGPGYVGTARAYPEGGYETQKDSSFVAPEVEAVLTKAISEALTSAPQ